MGFLGFDAIAADSTLLVCDQLNRRVLKFDPDTGASLGVFGDASDSGSSMITADSIALGTDGNVYVCSSAANQVLRFDTSGTSLGVAATIHGGNGAYDDIAIDGSGILYVAEQQFGVRRYSPAGADLGILPGADKASLLAGVSQYSSFGALTFDTAGNLHLAVTDPSNTGDKVVRFAANGSNLGAFGQAVTGSSPISLPIDVAFDPQGNLLVADLGEGILRYDTSGDYLDTIGSGSYSVATDAAGNIYTGDPGGRIRKYDSSGNLLGILVDVAEGLSNPVDLLLLTPAEPQAVPEIEVSRTPGNAPLLSGGQVGFGSVGASVTTTSGFSISNFGSTDLTGVALSLSGPDAGQFSLTITPAATIADGATSAFQIGFTPAGAIGPRNAVLTISSNDPDENPFTLFLSGELGIPPEDRTPVGDVSGGTVTAGNGEALDIGAAVGGTIDATAGTAFLTSLDGANLQVGSLGAFIEDLLSGNVDAEGNVTIQNLADGNVTIGQLAKLFAEQGNFLGTLSGIGELVKTGDGNLTIGLQSAFQGKVLGRSAHDCRARRPRHRAHHRPQQRPLPRPRESSGQRGPGRRWRYLRESLRPRRTA